MAYFYKKPDRDQPFLLPPSVSDWLPQDHLVWFLLDVVGFVDTERFDVLHPNDGVGRPAYDPEMMLCILVYGYCLGLRSSRRIEAACRSDLAFRAICVDLVPDSSAICRFRKDHTKAIEDVFVDVLRLCAKAGLASLGIIAIDGTKIASDASLDANRPAGYIRSEVQRILAEAEAADGEEPQQPTLAGELPQELARPGSRLARLQTALAEIEAEEAEKEAMTNRAAAEAAAGRKLRGRKPSDPHVAFVRAEIEVEAAKTKLASAKAKWATERAEQALSEAEERLEAARAAKQAAPPMAEAKANTTDAESRPMKTEGGWLQGYNCQAAVNENQIVLAPAVTQDHNDACQFVPMMNATQQMAEAAGIGGTAGTVVADAGYWSEENATAPGPDRLIATQKDWKQRKAARDLGTTEGPPPEDASALEAMEHRLRTADGSATYALRSCTVEPIFGQTKENRGIRRFMRRGLAAAQSEWSFICTTGNVLKLFSYAQGRPLAEILTNTG